jgi:hypothetical protein
MSEETVMNSSIQITPMGYQGAAQHTWTAGCDGFHESGPCPSREPVQEITVSGGFTLRPVGSSSGG